MYGSGAEGRGAKAGLDKVDIALIPDESGVYLRNNLIDAFYQNGYPASPSYVLRIAKIEEHKDDLDITIDSEATRKQIRLNTTIDLTDKATGAQLLSRRIASLASYNILGSQFTTRISEGDARKAALNDLARQIESQIALYFNR